MMKKRFQLPQLAQLLANRRGSTLIELLIAVMVVGLIVTAVANAVTYSIKNTGEARYRQVATTLGQQVLEHFRNKKNELGVKKFSDGFAELQYCYSDIENPTLGGCGSTAVITMAGTSFKRNVKVEKGGTGTRCAPYYLTFTVTVSWVDGAEIRDVELIQKFKQDSGFTNTLPCPD